MDLAPHWLRTGFDQVVGFAPRLLAGLIILLIGYIAARVLGRVTRALLHRVGFDRLSQKLGLSEPSEPELGSRWGGTIVFALVMLVTLMQVARAWQLALVAIGLAKVLAYLPHVAGAAVIFCAALYFGNWVRERILRGSPRAGAAPRAAAPMAAPFPPVEPAVAAPEHRVVATAVRAGILTLGAFMALRELQIGSEIVTIGFALVLGAIALAAALAFGLGSRDVAGRVTQQWYEQRSRGNGAPRARPETTPGEPRRL
jgi:hypothetical protein